MRAFNGRGHAAALRCIVLVAAAIASAAQAQNLDEGKPPAKLFADGCASCHRSPRGLAKGRFSFTLSWFLRDHYASSADSAKALASYLEALDNEGGAKARAAARSSKSASFSQVPRPPASVPGR